LVNFSMDFLCLYLCARLCHRPLSLWRGVVASALGGVYAVAVLLWTVGRLPAFLLDATVCVALCAVAMATRHETWRSMFKLSALYLLVSSVLGGVMTLLYSQLNRIPGVTDRVEEDGLAAWLFFALALVSSVLTALWGRCFRRETGRRRVRVAVEQQGRRAEICGIVDSGNLLRDPISGRPVIPVEAERLRAVAPPSLLALTEQTPPADALAWLEREGEGELARRLRLIPARSATGERLMVGWRPDRVTVAEEGRREERVIEALIVPVHLSGRGDGIAALLPSELI
jgi:stage II sporulation protein GA (sporulation sigma-E factor processing peptidase)